MILQALTKLYEDLAEQGKIAREGWSTVKISYLLEIDEDGTLALFLSSRKWFPAKRRCPCRWIEYCPRL